MEKVIRTICFFTKEPNFKTEDRLNHLKKTLEGKGYVIQTKRICSPKDSFLDLQNSIQDKSILLSIGSLDFQQTKEKINEFIKAQTVAFNMDLTNEEITNEYSQILFKIIKESPVSTFSFTYTFNNSVSSPYFPSAVFEQEGFAIGLQPTNLAKGCKSVDEWLNNLKGCWLEINSIFENEKDFLGIDSSIAPLFKEDSSLINFIKRLFPSFNKSILTNTYLKITKFIKNKNPKSVGLCGLMFPCLEDFELADEYEKGNFSVERNIFLSLHSGLGIDTYPIGIDEDLRKVTDILKTIQGLSNKYKKPLSVRFVSDGKSKIGKKTDFKNQYLKNIVLRKL